MFSLSVIYNCSCIKKTFHDVDNRYHMPIISLNGILILPSHIDDDMILLPAEEDKMYKIALVYNKHFKVSKTFGRDMEALCDK